MTQEKLGKHLGYTRNSVERWERGVYPVPLLVARWVNEQMRRVA
jgi:DNA-binding XRE family transcriptional regulator